MLADQLQILILISPKLKLDSSKNRRWTSSFRKYSRISVGIQKCTKYFFSTFYLLCSRDKFRLLISWIFNETTKVRLELPGCKQRIQNTTSIVCLAAIRQEFLSTSLTLCYMQILATKFYNYIGLLYTCSGSEAGIQRIDIKWKINWMVPHHISYFFHQTRQRFVPTLMTLYNSKAL